MTRTSVLALGLAGVLLILGVTTASPPAQATPTSSANSSVPARSGTSVANADADGFTDVIIPSRAQITTHDVTIALVAPQGTSPSFSASDASRALDLVDAFYDHETGGRIRFHLDRLVDWQTVDQPISCSDVGGLDSWVEQRTGWQPGAARHLVVIVPPGAPCPDWSNGSQPNSPDDGGLVFLQGADPIQMAHELGHNLSLAHATSLHCSTSWDVPVGADCPRDEYGNATDIMGGSWAFTPLSVPTLARLGFLADTRQPACGASRTTTIDSLGAGPGTPRALTWTDPQNAALQYWVQYNDKNDPHADGGQYTSQFETPRTISGVQILRTSPGRIGADLLERPGDDSAGNQFVTAGETVTLDSGMSVRVDAIDETTHTATVTATVPCTQYVGDITRFATPSASYTSNWSTVKQAVDGDVNTAWSTWPRAGAQWLNLAWPTAVTVDSASVRFASDATDEQQQGVIPARSWQVQYLDASTATWKTVGSTNPSVGGRERDVTNAVTFAPVRTTELRLVFQSWGSDDYAGSTAVSEVAIDGVPPVTSPALQGVAAPNTSPPDTAHAVSLVAHGAPQVISSAATTPIAQSVTLSDRSGIALPDQPVTFTMSGPATFTSGARAVTIRSDSHGVAKVPAVTAKTATGALVVVATAEGATAVTMPQIRVTSPPALKAKATTRKVGGQVSIAVVVSATAAGPTDFALTTPYGKATIAGVASGTSVTRLFSTGKPSVGAGSVTVAGTAEGLRSTVTAAYTRF